MITLPSGQSLEGSDFTFHSEGGNTPLGMSGKVYLDTKGIPTIGPGFNLNGGSAVPLIQSKGYDINALKTGVQKMSPDDMRDVFNATYSRSTKDAADVYNSHVGSSNAFDRLPQDARDVLTDMSYNMGKGGLSKWGNTMDLLAAGKYADAANHMKSQPWYSQVKSRGQAIVHTLSLLGNQSQYAEND